jgi:endonuclease/exonuclease/phosphatase (EEP) superfamily protein YafD
VNPAFAAVIDSALAGEYPYRILDPKPTVRGMGTLSRFPVEATGDTLELIWTGDPQLLRMDWDGTEVRVVNFHTLPARISWERNMRENVAYRNAQARLLSDYAGRYAHSTPMIVAGDLNAVDVSTTHRILTEHLRDAWQRGAIGLGNTFPNAPAHMQGILIPRLLFRIDYIFVSPQVRVPHASLGGARGRSDHRGVVAELYLQVSN